MILERGPVDRVSVTDMVGEVVQKLDVDASKALELTITALRNLDLSGCVELDETGSEFVVLCGPDETRRG